jgi:hypothetical protein
MEKDGNQILLVVIFVRILCCPVMDIKMDSWTGDLVIRMGCLDTLALSVQAEIYLTHLNYVTSQACNLP